MYQVIRKYRVYFNLRKSESYLRLHDDVHRKSSDRSAHRAFGSYR